MLEGTVFSQKAIDDGRLIFAHSAEFVPASDSFKLAVSDGLHDPSMGTVSLNYYVEPEELTTVSIADQQRNQAYMRAQNQNVVLWDAVRELKGVTIMAPSSGMTEADYLNEYVASYGPEIPQIMVGGQGADTLSGGMADDLIVGGVGEDLLSGGGGADRFVYNAGDIASDTITDYLAIEGDQIDLSELLSERQGMMHESIRFTIKGADTEIGLNIAPSDSGFTNQVLVLKDAQINDLAGYQLVLQDSVSVGGLTLEPSISVVATDSEASENVGNPGVFTFTRQGDLSSSVDVEFVINGSAQNGVDYSTVANVIHFDAGASTAAVVISPYADSVVESEEVVEISLVDRNEYQLGAVALATLSITDLRAVVSVEVLEAKGVVDPMMPAYLLVKRNGPTANSLLVRVEIGGTASNGSDYEYMSAFVSFAPGVTERLLEVLPKTTAVLSGGAESVAVEVLENSSYVLGDEYKGQVILVAQLDTLSAWKGRVAADDPIEDMLIFAMQVSGDGTVDNLMRYAYGMGAELIERDLLPRIQFRNGHMNVDFRKNLSATDVQFIVETSEDMQNWSADEMKIRKVSVPEMSSVVDLVTYEVVEPMVNSPKCYVRVRLIYSE